MADLTCAVFGLPFSMDDDGLYNFFSECGEIDNSRIVYQKGTWKSRGFGFVTFKDEKGYNACLKMNGCDCEGRQLNISKAKARETDSNGRQVYNDKNKIIVNCLSWDTTDDSLYEAFSKFGKVEECRVLVDRNSGQSRGCGIVRFSKEEDMNKAIEGMNETMLDGRQITVRSFAQKNPGYENKGRQGRDYDGNGSGRKGNRWNDEEQGEKEEKKERRGNKRTVFNE